MRSETIMELAQALEARGVSDKNVNQALTSRRQLDTLAALLVSNSESAHAQHVNALRQSLDVSIPIDNSISHRLVDELGMLTINYLRRADISDLVELTEMRHCEIHRLRGIGDISIKKLAQILARYNLSFYDA